jgi:hypothetical protein
MTSTSTPATGVVSPDGFPEVTGGASALALAAFLAGGARGMVAAQHRLDDDARKGFELWPETGIPPEPYMWSECRLRCPIAVGCEPRPRGGATFHIAPRQQSRATLTFTFRYLAAPFDDEKGW